MRTLQRGNREVWENLTAHVKRGEDAEELLEQIYINLGPYTNYVDPVTWAKVRDFFGFDDSE